MFCRLLGAADIEYIVAQNSEVQVVDRGSEMVSGRRKTEFSG